MSITEAEKAIIARSLEDLGQDIRDLAAALETVIASMLIGAKDPERAMDLLRAAQSMAAAIHGEIEGDSWRDMELRRAAQSMAAERDADEPVA
jgi:uncharacterized alpha-E superfamily protein